MNRQPEITRLLLCITDCHAPTALAMTSEIHTASPLGCHFVIAFFQEVVYNTKELNIQV